MVKCHALSGWVMPLWRRASAFAAHAARKTLGAGLMALAGAAVLGAAGVGPGSWVASANAAMFVPDPVFAGTLTNQQQNEMMQWGLAYFNRIEGVGGGVGSTFSFSTPAMNSQLFNPFNGPRQTLVKLGLIESTDGMRQLVEAPGADAASGKKREAIKDALVNFTFKTSPVNNPDGTANHIYKILDASSVSGLVTYVEGGQLISEKLPLDLIVAAGADPQFASTLSDATATAVTAILVAAPGYASTATGGSEAHKLISGSPSKADTVRGRIEQLLANTSTAGSYTDQGEISFGVYGSLPVIHVSLEDADLMIDALTGAVVGPMAPGSPVPTEALLSGHSEYVAGSGSIYLAGIFGLFPTSTLPIWHSVPPPGTYVPKSIPGTSPTSWTCTTIPPGPISRWNPFPTLLASCVCMQDTFFVTTPAGLPLGSPPFYKQRVVCQYLGPCAAPTALPSTPPALLPGPSPVATVKCITYYWY